jgi:predicted ATPase
MCATIDWSYSLLTAAEKRVFECLSVFSGGWTLAAAVTACSEENVADDEVLELLSSLVDKSLLVADFCGSEPRYRLLEPFRQYALQRLRARSEGYAATRRDVDLGLVVARDRSQRPLQALYRGSIAMPSATAGGVDVRAHLYQGTRYEQGMAFADRWTLNESR